jgi:hypothetical protein
LIIVAATGTFLLECLGFFIGDFIIVKVCKYDGIATVLINLLYGIRIILRRCWRLAGCIDLGLGLLRCLIFFGWSSWCWSFFFLFGWLGLLSGSWGRLCSRCLLLLLFWLSFLFLCICWCCLLHICGWGSFLFGIADRSCIFLSSWFSCFLLLIGSRLLISSHLFFLGLLFLGYFFLCFLLHYFKFFSNHLFSG